MQTIKGITALALVAAAVFASVVMLQRETGANDSKTGTQTTATDTTKAGGAHLNAIPKAAARAKELTPQIAKRATTNAIQQARRKISRT